MPDSHNKSDLLALSVVISFGVTVVLNLAEAIWDPSGAAWPLLRQVSAAVFTVLLIAYVVHCVRHRRSATSGGGPGDTDRAN
ncbi:hypothetical protein [Embleya sp. NPDC050493]|uniref:hypothetical protein n=1 Tax=Embleya sp. NPDC050493 TaxID=3363989 RepID=UPI0037B2125E